MYVQYFNYQYRRSGTLWEGRYKSCLVQAERYLIEVYRYIELNPVRANIVEDPSEYIWSSYPINALGKTSDLCTPHPEYLRLGDTKAKRMKNYRALFSHHVEDDVLEEIRSSANKGMAIGKCQQRNLCIVRVYSVRIVRGENGIAGKHLDFRAMNPRIQTP